MRRYYFAMVPKRSAVRDALVALGVGAGALYGAKRLLGPEKFHEYTAKARDAVFSAASGEPARERKAAEPDSGGASGMDRVRAALRLGKAAAKLLLVTNTKLLDLLSRDDGED